MLEFIQENYQGPNKKNLQLRHVKCSSLQHHNGQKISQNATCVNRQKFKITTLVFNSAAAKLRKICK